MTLRPCGDCGSGPLLVRVENAAGLPALAYRIGTHGRFKAAMRAALARQPALQTLTVEGDDDPSMALLDAWAAVLDVLTFYQERIANEGYIRTSAERRSLLELARAIGYELNPGVAASTYLAFLLYDTEGSPASITLQAGTRVQSVPGQDELPQMFETIESVEARTAWNRMMPQAAQFSNPTLGDSELYLRGTMLNLRAGDGLLVVGDERVNDADNDRWDFRRVREAIAVQPATPSLDPSAGYTRVVLDEALWSKDTSREVAKKNPAVFVFRQRAALFGCNAPDWRAMSGDVKASYGDKTGSAPDWPNFNIAYDKEIPVDLATIVLETVYPRIVAGSWIVISTPDHQELYSVERAYDSAMANFTLTSKTTRLDVGGKSFAKQPVIGLREAVIYAESERLELAARPLTSVVAGDRVTLDRAVEGLEAGQFVAVEGTDAATGVHVAEVLPLDHLQTTAGLTRLVFATQLQHAYMRETLTLNANVARATHGESQTEILGSGSGSTPFQKFVLKGKPLTCISAATSSGRQTTLGVRVNGVLWDEASSLHDRGPADRVYVTGTADDGSVTVEFGDGVTGARLPTGRDNVTATYRVGLGTAGLIEAGQINLLMSRPLGLKSAANPLPATGAADPETVDDARVNAPLTVMTLDRIVSRQDFEDFSRAFAGIGKAQATMVWNGERSVVHITVAGVEGALVEQASALYSNLEQAIDSVRQTDQSVQIDSYRPLGFKIDAKIIVNPKYSAGDVFAAIRSALIDEFSFARRAFGQGVTQGEVMAVVQGVSGVTAVDLDALYSTGAASALNRTLVARRAYWNGSVICPAELLTVDPLGVLLK